MTVAKLTIGKREFVVIPKREYERLCASQKASRRTTKLSREDQRDLALAIKRLSDPNEKPIPYAQVRRELGLQ